MRQSLQNEICSDDGNELSLDVDIAKSTVELVDSNPTFSQLKPD